MLDVSSTPEITPIIESSTPLDGGSRGQAPVNTTVPVGSSISSSSNTPTSDLGGAGGSGGSGRTGAFRTQPMSTFEKIQYTVTRRYSMYRDASIPFLKARWIGTTVLALLYLLRVHALSGFYIVTYALGIYLLNLLIGFLTPAVDPESFTPTPAEDDEDGAPVLPTSSTNSDEFRPFVRRLPEFKFWLSTTRALLISFFCTFFPFLDIPVFWPILLIYFIALFSVTMKNRIKHMIKHKYIPIVNIGKPKFSGK